MKKLLLATLAALGITQAAHADGIPDLVTIVVSQEAQTQLMSMVLTMQSVQQGASAHVLLCGPAGDLALKDAPKSATTGQKPRDMSPQGLMQAIMANGATVEVCAIYLPNKGLEQDSLLDGITAADPAEMAGRLLAPNTRIMSF